MRAVNLLPEDTKSRRLGMPGAVPVAGAAATLAAVGVIMALAHVESGTVASRQARVDDLQQQLSRVPTQMSATSTAGSAILTSHDSRTAAVEAALKARVPWDTVLRQLALILPEGTWLDGLQLAAPGASVAGAPAAAPDPAATPTSGVVITGYTASAASLALVLQRISAVPSLTSVKLQPSQVTTLGKKSLFKFAIGANIATGGTP